MSRVSKFIYPVIFAVSILLLAILFSFGDRSMHVYFFDVGQGDAIFIILPTKETILVDGGPDDIVLQQLGRVLPFYDRTIDLMILTHPHADHINGLIEVLKKFEVRNVMITGVAYNDSSYDEFLSILSQNQTPVIYLDGGSDYKLSNVIFDIIYPLRSIQGEHFENVNNSSVTFRLIYGKTVFYFSGDLEVEGEEKIIQSGLELDSDVYKAGHHGSRTSSSVEILDLIKPEYAVISCGVDNSFGHPHYETLRNFRENGIKILRTDLEGDIHFSADLNRLLYND